jgi:glycine C-acetyltransferase
LEKLQVEQWEDNHCQKKEIIELLRQRSRPYLFSNSLAPAIVGASIKVLNY